MRTARSHRFTLGLRVVHFVRTSRSTLRFFLLIQILLLAAASTAHGDPVFVESSRVDDGINPQHREPSVACDPDGRVYAAYCELAEPSLNPQQIRITWSDDRGQSWWWPAVRVSDNEPFTASTPDVGLAPDGALLLVWDEYTQGVGSDIRFSRSTSRGLIWSPSVPVHLPDPSDIFASPSVLAVGSRILVSYLWGDSGGYKIAVVTMSDDCGVTWSPPAVVSTLKFRGSAPPAILAWNEEEQAIGILISAIDRVLYVCRSSDLGETWSEPVQASGAWDTNYASFGAGESFHVVWSARQGDSYSNIYYTNSDDGTQFSDPLQISGYMSGAQYEPHLAVGPRNRIHVCWTFQLSLHDHNLRYTQSVDGGGTWPSHSIQVNDPPHVVVPLVPHTSDLTADPYGRPICFWNDHRVGGNYPNVYCSTAEDVSGIGEAAVEGAGTLRLGLADHPSPDPGVRLALDRDTPWVIFELYDLTGRLVLANSFGSRSQGTHEAPLWGALGGRTTGPGVYFLRVRAARESRAVRVVTLH